MHAITIRHNFETAHRLPHIHGKCQSLHGHSWWAEITVTAPRLDPAGMIVEFGPFKNAVRAWIDEHLDHGVLLGPKDPMLQMLRDYDAQKVYVVPGWPTVENVAALLARTAADILQDHNRPPGTEVSRVHLAETHVNAATWTAAP